MKRTKIVFFIHFCIPLSNGTRKRWLWRSGQASLNKGRDYNNFFQISEYTFGLRQKDLNKSQQMTFGFGFVQLELPRNHYICYPVFIMICLRIVINVRRYARSQCKVNCHKCLVDHFQDKAYRTIAQKGANFKVALPI